METKDTTGPDLLFAPRPIAPTQRQADALDELRDYLDENRGLLDVADRSLYEWGSSVVDAFTRADTLEDTLDTLRACIGDEYNQDDREVVAGVHYAMSGGVIPTAGRSRYSHWSSSGSGVRCHCGRVEWGWTLVKDQTPVDLGPHAWKWWRVQCVRCGFVSLVLYPDLGGGCNTEAERAEIDKTHRAFVESYRETTPHAPSGVEGGPLPSVPHE